MSAMTTGKVLLFEGALVGTASALRVWLLRFVPLDAIPCSLRSKVARRDRSNRACAAVSAVVVVLGVLTLLVA